MTRKHTFAIVAAAAFLGLGNGAANAGKTVDDAGTITCVMDKWEESEPDKGHKLAKSANRCVLIPDDPGAPKVTEDCTGNYEYMPDKSWKASGTCTDNYPGGDKTSLIPSIEIADSCCSAAIPPNLAL